jgi:predicted lysophospholipase L1 biosynthesis ABC-type transport system permease subunit
LGLTMKMNGKQLEIVGVAARARYSRVTQQPNVVYLPNSLSQDTETIVLRTSIPPMQALPAVQRMVNQLDAYLPLVTPISMEEQIATTLRRERLFAWLCGSFGVLALLLCTIGLYGVMSYATARRSQEIGIRMALGASFQNVLRHVVGEGMAVAAFGLLLGAPIPYYLAQKYVDYKQLGMEPIDPRTIGWAIAALGISALLAVLGPALRAAASDPLKALRQG